MRKIKAEKLSHEAFHFYGDFADMIPEQLPDMNMDQVLLDLGRPYENCAFSLIRSQVCENNTAIMAEYHSLTGQAFLPMDGDVLLYVARPTTGDCPIEKMRAFYVPKGTLVVVKPGVWHFTPMAVERPVNVMISLVQRTWANDVTFYGFKDEEKFQIEIE